MPEKLSFANSTAPTVRSLGRSIAYYTVVGPRNVTCPTLIFYDYCCILDNVQQYMGNGLPSKQLTDMLMHYDANLHTVHGEAAWRPQVGAIGGLRVSLNVGPTT